MTTLLTYFPATVSLVPAGERFVGLAVCLTAGGEPRFGVTLCFGSPHAKQQHVWFLLGHLKGFRLSA